MWSRTAKPQSTHNHSTSGRFKTPKRAVKSSPSNQKCIIWGWGIEDFGSLDLAFGTLSDARKLFNHSRIADMTACPWLSLLFPGRSQPRLLTILKLGKLKYRSKINPIPDQHLGIKSRAVTKSNIHHFVDLVPPSNSKVLWGNRKHRIFLIGREAMVTSEKFLLSNSSISQEWLSHDDTLSRSYWNGRWPNYGSYGRWFLLRIRTEGTNVKQSMRKICGDQCGRNPRMSCSELSECSLK
jgi:hypothetical protein